MRVSALTKNQKLVYTRLARAGRAMSAYDLLDELREDGLRAPAQVYRALDKLSGEGLIHRIETLNAYVACARTEHDSAAAFAICDSCGTVREFSPSEAMETLGHWAHGVAFDARQVTIELRGRCKDCAGAELEADR